MSERKEPHKRPTPEQLDERVAIAYPDPEAVIEALMQVDPDAAEAQSEDREGG